MGRRKKDAIEREGEIKMYSIFRGQGWQRQKKRKKKDMMKKKNEEEWTYKATTSESTEG